jgi:hypothetical protein
MILAFMPGLVFLRGYYVFPYPRAVSTTDEIVGAMIFAIPFQAVAISIVDRFTPYRIDFVQLGTLMDGAKSDLANRAAFGELTTFLWPIIGYNLVLWGLAYLCGHLLRWLVINCEWDIDRPWLRFSSEWYYLLSGRQWRWEAEFDFDLILADVMVMEPAAPVIYSGILSSVHFARDGAVESLVFNLPKKWAVPGSYTSQPIPGQAFVIKFDQVLNLNFRLFKIDKDKEAPDPNPPPPPAGGHLADARSAF